MITSLLDLSKLEQGVMRLEPREVDPTQVVEDLERTFAPHAHKKDVTIETRVADGLPLLHADPMRLKQILFNLAENAVKFTPAGGKTIFSVEATEWEDEPAGGFGAVLMGDSRPAVAFAVSDTGIGMRTGELERIFDAFYQVDGSSTREHGGTGLGLSIVKRLVDAHGGRIEVSSELGEGTTFKVIIPEPEDEQ